MKNDDDKSAAERLTYTAVDGLGILELGLKPAEIESAYHTGQCFDDAAAAAALPYIARQLDAAGAEKIRRSLAEISGWDLSDDDLNRARAVWIAAGNIQEESK